MHLLAAVHMNFQSNLAYRIAQNFGGVKLCGESEFWRGKCWRIYNRIWLGIMLANDVRFTELFPGQNFALAIIVCSSLLETVLPLKLRQFVSIGMYAT